MKLIDLHCDTLSKIFMDRTEHPEREKDLKSKEYCINIEGLKRAGSLAQFFACFTYMPSAKGGYEECYGQALSMIDILKENCEIYQDEIALAGSYADVLENEKQNRISALLTIEEGGVVCGKMERIEELYRRGVRLLTPMWNYENCFGHPNSSESKEMAKGLKDFGKEAVRYGGELGIVIDVSHASDGSFWDILDCARGAVVASHSNCRALCEHPRNLSDDMIRALAERGGVAGLNFYGRFLDGSNESRLEAMTAHVQHMIQMGGSEFPAIGTDFDGFDGMAYEDIPTIDGMEKLWDTLKRSGLSENQLDRLWRGNAERILRNI